MNTPFPISLAVRQLNRTDEVTYSISDEYGINVTLKHSISSIKHSIWINSEDHFLKPVFFRILFMGRSVNDSDRLCDILQTYDFPPQIPDDGFVLEVDFSLLGSTSVPNRDPVEELFDIVLLWKDPREHEHTTRIRESLACTIGVLKDFFIEQSRKGLPDGTRLTRDSVSLILKSSEEMAENDDQKLAQLLKLDVTPLQPIVFLLEIDYNEEVETHQYTRFHIKAESEISQLQEENSLVEVNERTSVSELKLQLIERIDQYSVRRTFEEQLWLSYQGNRLANGNLVEALGLSVQSITQARVITLKVDISPNVSGTNGLLSRDFLNDLRRPNRFEFLPRRPNPHTTATPSQERILPIDPTRIVLENGVEWNLTGESYERIRPNRSTLTSPESSVGELLVDQSDISSVDYEFTLQVGGQVQQVSLNTSQCIIVDKGDHPPYLLLSPAGAAKLCRQFQLPNGDPLIQQVQVLMYEQPLGGSATATGGGTAPTPLPTPTTSDGDGAADPGPPTESAMTVLRRWWSQLFGRADAAGSRALLLAVKFFFLMKFMGVDFPLSTWLTLLVVSAVGTVVYVAVFRGHQVAALVEEHFPENDQVQQPWVVRPVLVFARVARATTARTSGVWGSIGTELVSVLVSRTRDYEYILDGRQGTEWAQFWYWVRDGAANAWKDVVLWGLTFVPDVDNVVSAASAHWRDHELVELVRRVDLEAQLMEVMMEVYEKKFDARFPLPSSLDYEMLHGVIASLETEDDHHGQAYRLLLEFSLGLQQCKHTLNAALARGQPLAEPATGPGERFTGFVNRD